MVKGDCKVVSVQIVLHVMSTCYCSVMGVEYNCGNQLIAVMRRHSSMVVSKTTHVIAIEDKLGSEEVHDFSTQIIKATYCLMLSCFCSLLTPLQDILRKAVLVGLHAVSTKSIKPVVSAVHSSLLNK